MIRNIAIGIDIGSSFTRVVIGEFLKGEKIPKIIGASETPSKGVRHGYVIDPKIASSVIKKGVAQAEQIAGIKIKKISLSVGGATLGSDTSIGTTIISKADGEVTTLDISKALEDCEENINLNNKKVLKIIPLSYKLDGKEIMGRPEGMKGTKLETKALFITCSIAHFEDLMEAVALAGLEPINIVASVVSGSAIALSQKQKIAGGALVDIGSEKVSLAVYENGILISAKSFSIGGTDVTNDIALGMKVSLEEADKFKTGNIPENISKKKLDEIIEARMADIFELIENHLKKIKRNELLPAGVVFTGGSAGIKNLEEMSKSSLKLPAKIGTTEIFGNTKTKLKDPSWYNALGLLFNKEENARYQDSAFSNIFKNLKNLLESNIRQFMP